MRVIDVRHLSGYRIEVTFGNKEVKVIDLSEKVKKAKGIFLPLKDLEYFKKVSVDDSSLSICWPNGADICPDVLYSMGDLAQKRSRKKSFSKKNVSRNRLKKSKIS